MIKRVLISLLSVVFSPLALSEQATTPAPTQPEVNTETRLPLAEIRRFSEAFEQIRRHYVEDVSDATLLDYAIRGMLEGLDPHSIYLEPDSLDEFKEMATGEFGGLGIEIGMKDGYVHVITPIDDTPAYKAGIEAGDYIVKLEGISVRGMSLDEAIEHMRGEVGTDITVTIAREGQQKPFDVVITRDTISLRSVRSEVHLEHFGYLRIAQFQANTGEQSRKELAKLLANNTLKGIVLDLRNNPGGVMRTAVEVVDNFIGDGLVVSTKGRHKDSNTEFHAGEQPVLTELPLVVLINQGSASAAEIVAGALQDHGRAVIVGTPSFGKGSVQVVIPVAEDRAIKLTQSRYFTPNGSSIQAKGIEPDVLVPRAKVKPIKPSFSVKEAQLEGHLENQNESGKDKLGISPLFTKDNQLYQALALLKGMSISQSKTNKSGE